MKQNTELYHHGVKDMRWGIRKKRTLADTLRKRGTLDEGGATYPHTKSKPNYKPGKVGYELSVTDNKKRRTAANKVAGMATVATLLAVKVTAQAVIEAAKRGKNALGLRDNNLK